MTSHVPYQIDEASPADKARVLSIARALGMPDEVIRMLGLDDMPEPIVARPARKKAKRLTDEEVRLIRSSGESAKALAFQLDASVSVVQKIRSGVSRGDVR